MAKPGKRPVIDLEAERRSLDVVEPLDALVVLRPVELEAVSRPVPTRFRRVRAAGLAPREIACPENRRRDRLRPGGPASSRPYGSQAQVHPELCVWTREAEVRPIGELVLPVVINCAFVPLVVS